MVLMIFVKIIVFVKKKLRNILNLLIKPFIS